MTNRISDESQRKVARVAGFSFLSAMAIVVIANYGIGFRLIIPGNASETARNIMAHQLLFRINIACDLVYVVNLVVMLASLYVVLKSVNRNLALVAAFCRLIFAFTWVVTALNLLGALRLLGDAAYLSVFSPDQLQSLARLHIAATSDSYYTGLPFWGLASAICGCLFFKSGYIPRALAAFGVASSLWCVFCALAYLISPNFQNTVGLSWFDMPLVIFEMSLGVWLLFKGLRHSSIVERGKATG